MFPKVNKTSHLKFLPELASTDITKACLRPGDTPFGAHLNPRAEVVDRLPGIPAETVRWQVTPYSIIISGYEINKSILVTSQRVKADHEI